MPPCGAKSQGIIVKENAKQTAPKRAEPLDTSRDFSHSHMPERARKSLSAATRRKADGSGSGIARSVNGEKAADCPLAASGVPHPFHRSRQGADPSSQAARTASAHGRNGSIRNDLWNCLIIPVRPRTPTY